LNENLGKYYQNSRKIEDRIAKNHMKNDLLDPGGKKTEGSAPETDAGGNFQKGK
jgi:hypothetical protein